MNLLLVYPEHPRNTWWSFQHTMRFIGRRATMPPLGLITVAAMLPDRHNLRLVDCNVSSLTAADLAWADVMLTSTMIVQRNGLARVAARAAAAGIPVIAGGPHPSSTEDLPAGVTTRVIGEAESIFSQVLRDLEAGCLAPLYQSDDKPELGETPLPRFDLLDLDAYATQAVQASRGCPYRCEFCDIWSLYGRRPRVKPPARFVAELDALHAAGWRGSTFVVDDNFIGDPRRAAELLAAIADWQRAHRYPLRLFTEASVNLAQRPELLEGMREAGFDMVFLGIETPDTAALQGANKSQNLCIDLHEAVARIQRAGIEVSAGFIVGFDADDEGAFARQRAFIQSAGIPMAMTGLLTALPGTALYRRLESEGRLRGDSSGNNTHAFETNFETRLPGDVLANGYRGMLLELYGPTLTNYLDRCRTFLRRLGPNPLFSREVRWREVRALLLLLVTLPFIRPGRNIARFLAWALFRKPAQFAEAVRLCIMGIHFQRITRTSVAAWDFSRLLAETRATLEAGGSPRAWLRALRRLRKQYRRLPVDAQEQTADAWVAFVSEARAHGGTPDLRDLLAQSWQETLERFSALEERFQATCESLLKSASPTRERAGDMTTQLRRQRKLLLRDARARLRALPPEIRALARRRYRRLRHELSRALEPLESPGLAVAA